jgi:20S proteasome subunit alpha 4
LFTAIFVYQLISLSLSLPLSTSTQIIIRLQDPRTIRKIVSVDERSTLAFAGLTADARVLINKTRTEAQSYRLTCEDAPSVEYLARYIARTQQKYTQRGGVRPFGIATLLAGFSEEGDPVLYQTDPAGTHSEWKAQVIGGRNAKSLREFLEKNWEEGLSEEKAVRMGVQALLEVVDSGAKNMEICVVRAGGMKSIMEEKEVDEIVKDIEREAEEGKATTSEE